MSRACVCVVDKPFIHTDTNPYCNSLYFTALHDITRYTEYFIFRTGFCDSVHKVCVLVSCHFPSIWGAWDLSTKPSQFPPTTCPSLTIAPCSQHSQTCILMQSPSSDWGVIHSERYRFYYRPHHTPVPPPWESITRKKMWFRSRNDTPLANKDLLGSFIHMPHFMALESFEMDFGPICTVE